MLKDCFARLLNYGKKFDEDIRKLIEIWRYPQNIMRGYTVNSTLAENNLQTLKSEIMTLKTNIIDDIESQGNHIAEMNRFIEESQQVVDDIIQSCNDIEIVLAEYGYVGLVDESLLNKEMETECSLGSSLISSDVTDDLLEVEFTPCMSWRHKGKTNNGSLGD